MSSLLRINPPHHDRTLLLENQQLRNILILVDFIKFSYFMYEHASWTIATISFLMEGLARLWFILLIGRFIFLHQLSLSMGELTFWTIPAVPLLYPILTHLSLILCLIYFSLSNHLLSYKLIFLFAVRVLVLTSLLVPVLGGCLELLSLLLPSLNVSWVHTWPLI